MLQNPFVWIPFRRRRRLEQLLLRYPQAVRGLNKQNDWAANEWLEYFIRRRLLRLDSYEPTTDVLSASNPRP